MKNPYFVGLKPDASSIGRAYGTFCLLFGWKWLASAVGTFSWPSKSNAAASAVGTFSFHIPGLQSGVAAPIFTLLLTLLTF